MGVSLLFVSKKNKQFSSYVHTINLRILKFSVRSKKQERMIAVGALAIFNDTPLFLLARQEIYFKVMFQFLTNIKCLNIIVNLSRSSYLVLR